MTKCIRSSFRKLPFYRAVQKIFYALFRAAETCMLGTKMQEWIWRVRHVYKGKDWAKGYCRATGHPHRKFLIDRISSYAPLEKILEIGCNTGPNLYLLSEAFPQAELYGIDINACAVKEGRAWLSRQGIKNVDLRIGKADKIENFGDKSVDIIFTDAVLLYVGPDKIERTIGDMCRKAKKALVFCEWHLFEGCIPDEKKFIWYDGHWIYNYKKLFEKHVHPDNVKISGFTKALWNDESWKKFGAVIEVGL